MIMHRRCVCGEGERERESTGGTAPLPPSSRLVVVCSHYTIRSLCLLERYALRGVVWCGVCMCRMHGRIR